MPHQFLRKLLSYILAVVLIAPYFIHPTPLFVSSVRAESLDSFPATSEENNSYDLLLVDTSTTYFVNDPKYVRANHSNDLAAQIVTPDETTDVRFYVDDDTTPIPGQNIGQAGATTSWWRLYTPLPAGMHLISVEIMQDGEWYPVYDTGIVYSLDGPWAQYVQPTVGAVYRTTDNPVRVKVEDQFEQFRRMIVKIDGESYEVMRDQCDLRQAGNYLLCDVDKSPTWTGLTEGTYTALTTTYTKANNRVDNLLSEQFVIDGTPPVVSDFSAPELVSKPFDVSAKATDGNGIDKVKFYISERNEVGECKNNLPAVVEVLGTHAGGELYTAQMPIAGLQGDYCMLVSARDNAAHNSTPLFQKLHIDSTAPALIVLDADSKKLLTEDDSIFVKATDLNGVRQIHANIRKVDENGRVPNDVIASYPFMFDRNNVLNEIIHEVPMFGLEDGKYELRLGALDTLMNRTENIKHYFTIDNTAPDGNIVYFGGLLSDGVRYISSIEELSFSGEFTDVNELERTNYVVWKVDDNFKNRVLYCGNWGAGASTYMPLSGDSDSVNGMVKDCAPSKTWEDGNYEIGHRVYDILGNFRGLNSPTQKFLIDSEAPDVQITYPSDGQLVNGNVQIRGTVEEDQLLRYYYKVGNTSKTVYSDSGFIDMPIYDWDTTTLPDGEYTIRLEARDKAGNKDGGSVHQIKVFVDNTAPSVGISDVEVLSENELQFSGYVFDENFSHYYCWLTGVTGGEISGTRDANCITTWAKDLQRNGNPATSTNEGDGTPLAPVRLGGFDISGLEEGEYIVHIGAKDKVGNLQIVSMQFTLSFDVEEEEGEQEEELEETTPDTTSDTSDPNTDETPSTEEEVLGASIRNITKPSNPTPNRIERNFPLLATNLTVEKDDNEGTEEVLGEQTCSKDKVLGGKVFIDKNANGTFDQSEDEAVSNITVMVYTTDENGERVLVKSVVTDANGDWELEVCAGSYEAEISESELPENVTVEKNTQTVEIDDGTEDNSVWFALLANETDSVEQSFFSKYRFWVITAIVLSVVAGGAFFSRKSKLNG